jgi:hypothetical protein
VKYEDVYLQKYANMPIYCERSINRVYELVI